MFSIIIYQNDDWVLDEQVSLNEYGFINLLEKFSNNGPIKFSVLQDVAEISNVEFIQLLESLSKKNLISYQKKTIQEQISLEISFITKVVQKSSASNSLSEYFDLDVNYARQLQTRNLNANEKNYLLSKNILETTQNKIIDHYTINTQNDYIIYLESVKPLHIWKLANLSFDIKDVQILLAIIQKKKIQREFLNFAIDHSLTTSKYHNINLKFTIKLIETWDKEKFENLTEAIDFVQKSKIQNKYTEPVYNYNEEKATESIEEINGLLEKVFK